MKKYELDVNYEQLDQVQKFLDNKIGIKTCRSGIVYMKEVDSYGYTYRNSTADNPLQATMNPYKIAYNDFSGRNGPFTLIAVTENITQWMVEQLLQNFQAK